MDNTAATTLEEQRRSLLPTALIAAAFLVVAIVFCASSNWYATFKAVHVGFAAIWIGGGFLLTILGVIAERQNDPQQLAAIAKQAAFVGQKLFSPSAGIVLVAGIAMMINTNWGWDHFWITAGLVGFAVLGPRSHRVDELIRTVGVEAAETQAAIRQLLLIARFDVAVLLLVIIDMVVKPFST